MKFTRRLTAFIIAAVMLISTCVVAGALSATQSATVSFSSVTTTNLANSVKYVECDITGNSSDNTSDAWYFEFNPNDGAIPLAYCTDAGDVTLVEDHVKAAKAEGYTVLGAINASFFNMANGAMEGLLISKGRIVSGDSETPAPDEEEGETASCIAFDSDGKMTRATYDLEFDITVNGTFLSNSLIGVNKKYTYVNDARGSSATDKVFFYDSLASADNAYAVSGYEILCKKADYDELALGETLNATVVSVSSNRNYGTTIPTDDDRFVLFVKSTSSYASYFSNLSAGDTISIDAKNTDTSSVDVLNNAYSAVSGALWLVENGVDHTNSKTVIKHDVMGYQRAWTAIGVKPDGSYIIFASKEYGIDLKDVAAALVSKGCNNVLRLDGGGSVSVYADGKGDIVYTADQNLPDGRPVADALLIVTKESATDSSLEAQLRSVVDTASEIKYPSPEISSQIEEAKKLLATDHPLEGDVEALLSEFNHKTVLQSLITLAENVNTGNFDSDVYSSLTTSLNNAKALIDNGTLTQDNAKTYASSLAGLLAKSYVISLYADYKTTTPNYTGSNGKFMDDGIRLTNGIKNSGRVTSNDYSGWQTTDENPISFFEVTLDLGSAVKSNVYTVYTSGGNYWGINNATGIKVYGSNDGINFTAEPIGTSDTVQLNGEGRIIDKIQSTLHSITVISTAAQEYRYIKFVITRNPESYFLWIDEVEAAYAEKYIEDEPPVVPDPDEDIIYGDVNMSYNGSNAESAVNISDCILIKRNILKTYEFNDDQFLRGDINEDGKINISDYILCKRIILKTYSK